MTRILHTADLHLDAPLRSLALSDPALRNRVETATRAAFERIVDVAIARDVAALTIGGDLFDGRQRSVKTGVFLIRQLERMRDAGVCVFLIRGNHDAENPVLGQLDLPDHVHLFTGRGGAVELEGHDVVIHGVSFAERTAPQSLLPKFRAPVPGKVNIGLLHTSLNGAEGHDVYAPCSEAELAATGFDAWLLGHVHRRLVLERADGRPLIVMPGTPQGRDMGEAGPKSATLLHIGAGAIRAEEVPTHRIEFRRTEMKLPGAADLPAARHAMAEHLAVHAPAPGGSDVVLRIALRVEEPANWGIRRDLDTLTEFARGEAHGLEGLWVEALDLSEPHHGTRPKTSGAAADAVAELGAIMSDLLDDPGMMERLSQDVATLVADLPPEARDSFGADETARAEQVAALGRRGALEITALLRGAGAGPQSDQGGR